MRKPNPENPFRSGPPAYLFQTGQNFGKGKFGYDPLDILFKSIQQPHEEVTVKMCKTDENGKPVCQ